MIPPEKPSRKEPVALLSLLSLIRAKSLPGSAPQAPGRAVARDHALLQSRDGRFVARARRAFPHAAAQTRIISVPEFCWFPGNPCDLSKGYFATTFLSSSLTCRQPVA